KAPTRKLETGDCPCGCNAEHSIDWHSHERGENSEPGGVKRIGLDHLARIKFNAPRKGSREDDGERQQKQQRSYRSREAYEHPLHKRAITNAGTRNKAF